MKKKRRGFPSKVRVMSLGIVIVLLISFCAQLRASQSVTLGWNAEPGTNVAGYALYYGNVSTNYSSRIDAGTNLSATATGLAEGQTYYFAVTAYNAAKVESAPSAPVPYLVPGILAMTPASAAAPMSIKFPVAPGHTYLVQASTDLNTWTNLWQTGIVTSNAWVSFQDSQSGSFKKRFYRLYIGP